MEKIMKWLVVLSGGMDSATALSVAIKAHPKGKDYVEAITFHYGSKHNDKENKCATELAMFHQIKHTIVQLPFINELFKSDLLKSGGDVPEGHYAEENMKKTVVPFRNGIMLSIATGYAESIGANKLFIGNHAGDHAIYPDCRLEFTSPFRMAMMCGTWSEVELTTPFQFMSKADIVKQGTIQLTPYELTWSCYKGGEKHCGKCGTCVERLEAFDLAGVMDPVEYEDRVYYKTVLAKNKS